MPENLAYFCGRWIPATEVAIPTGDLGFTMGVTVTERLRTFAGQVFCKREHLARMRRSLEIVGLPADNLTDEIDATIDEFLTRHRDQIATGDDWAIVAFATPGSGEHPTVCVHGFPLAFGQWADEFANGVVAYISEHRQVPPDCWPAELKCRSRMHYYLADCEARRRRPRACALLLDQEGFLGEGSTTNLVMYNAQTGLATPKPTKVLPGVSMAVIAELAAKFNVPFVQRDISVDEFAAADEAWLTSTSICMLPVVELDERPIATGSPGEMYRKFLSAWSDRVGVDIARQALRFTDRV